MAKRRRRQVTEARFDLEQVRTIKRKARALARYIEGLERGMLKFQRSENKRKAESKRRKRAEPHMDLGLLPDGDPGPMGEL